FVPMMQELVRQSIAGSGTITQRTAGHQASDTDSLVLIRSYSTRPDTAPSDPSRTAGLYASLDDQGGADAIIAINPDAAHSISTPISKDELAEQLRRVFSVDSIDWIATQTDSQTNPKAPTLSSINGGFRFAGIVFLLAAILGLIELVLARVFSFRADAQQAGSEQ
ncbi:MAG: hypothetical protein JKY96_08300, partial [Phycisphaerales bacterium]|nr:hypothetical protein [Phycisphaerales bacterium]